MATFEPKPFGKYFLIDKLAIGGMAEIYKAKTFGVDGFEKLLAIKKILPHCSADKEFISMLTDEAKLVVRLSHTNIVQIYDLGKVGDDYYISMEFIDGINLRELINRGKDLDEKVPVPTCLYIISEVCKGLDYAHSKRDENNQPLNIVHRDVSPQNILISYEGEPKIVDFGIAKAAMNISQTTAGILKGKITYMSPEQALGKPIDHRTDVFSVGIILYELLTGDRLFKGETQFEVLRKIRNTQITAETLSKKIPNELRLILSGALAYNPKNRYETAGDLQIELTKMLYSQYVDFSPKQLANLIRKWFAPELKIKRKKTQEQTIIDSKTRSILLDMKEQESIVHRDEKLEKPIPPELQDTTKPEDIIRPSHLEHPAEKPSKAASAPAVRGIPSQKKKVFPAPLLFVLLAAIAVGIYFFFFLKPTPTPTMGEIDISSEPPGAKILVNGKDSGKTTPALIDNLSLSSSHAIKLNKEGFKPWKEQVVFENANAVSLEATLEPLPLGSLELKSQPDEAHIFIDGKDSGQTTPTKLTELEIGKSYQIRLAKEGYLPFEEEVTISGEELVTLNWTLEKIVWGTVHVSSNPPGAQIFLNKKDTGLLTPASLKELEIPKNYTIGLTKKGYKEASRGVTLSSKDPLKLDFKLDILPAKIEVETNVKGAAVTMNGRRVGTSPHTFEVKPGIIRLQLSKKGYKTVKRRIAVEAGQTKKVQISMMKEEVRDVPTSGQTDAKVRVDSTPRGASVVIDGKKAGVTPILIRRIGKNQSHTVSLTLPGYRNWTKTFQTRKDYMEIMAPLQKE